MGLDPVAREDRPRRQGHSGRYGLAHDPGIAAGPRLDFRRTSGSALFPPHGHLPSGHRIGQNAFVHSRGDR